MLYAGVAEWQTRQTQNLLFARTYGFESHHRHFIIPVRESMITYDIF